ncbi:MAG: hypothetical protein ACKPKO_05135 [Candidatus Fonsibacter sp.]
MTNFRGILLNNIPKIFLGAGNNKRIHQFSQMNRQQYHLISNLFHKFDFLFFPLSVTY